MIRLRWPTVGQEIKSKTGRVYIVTHVNEKRFKMSRPDTGSTVSITKARAIKALALKQSGAVINPQKDICYTVAIAYGVVWCIGGVE